MGVQKCSEVVANPEVEQVVKASKEAQNWGRGLEIEGEVGDFEEYNLEAVVAEYQYLRPDKQNREDWGCKARIEWIERQHHEVVHNPLFESLPQKYPSSRIHHPMKLQEEKLGAECELRFD